ncbi:hypothetical protein ACA910_014736 [Epithemia clementina (nom. ined.)]
MVTLHKPSLSYNNKQQRRSGTKAAAVDVSSLPSYNLDKITSDGNGEPIAKGGVSCPFPWRLHECLDAVEKEGLQHIVSWQPHGRSFTVYQPKKFVELVMPRFFGQSKYASFQRQLNIYGFSRFANGKDKGAYFHLCFVRGHRSLVRNMVRCKIKSKAADASISKPLVDDFDFYHPAWLNHFEPTVPLGSLKPPTMLAQAQLAQHLIPSFLQQQLPSNSFLPLVGRNIVVPSSSAFPSSPSPLNTPNMKSSIPQETAPALASEPFFVVPPKNESKPLKTTVEPNANASVVSDDLSMPHDELSDLDLNMAFFEGSPFHLFEDPTLYEVPNMLEDADAYEPTPILEGAMQQQQLLQAYTNPCCCTCQCSKHQGKPVMNCVNYGVNSAPLQSAMDPLSLLIASP